MTAVRRLKLAAMLSAAASVLFIPGAALAQKSFDVAQAAANCADAKSHFEIAREINTPDAYQAHIDAFPNCPYAEFARILRDKLTKGSAAAKAPPAPAQAATAPASPGSSGAPAAAQATTAPAQTAVPADQAKQMAEVLVDRLNKLPLMQAADAPKVHYDTATMKGGNLILTNLRLTKLDRQAGWSGLTFDEARVVAPKLSPDGTFEADLVQLKGGSIRADGENGPNDRVATIQSATVGRLYLAGSGGAVGNDRLGPVSADGLSASGITGYNRQGAIFTIAAVSLAATGTSAHVPNTLALSLSDLSLSAAQMAAGTESPLAEVKKLGYDPFVFSGDLVLKQDPSTKTLVLQHGISLKDGGQLRLQATIDAFDPAVIEATLAGGNPAAALMSLAATLKNARLDYVDQSLTGKVLTMAAQSENIDPKLFTAAIPSVVKESVAQATGSAKLAETLASATDSFVSQPKSVSLSLDPSQPVALAQLFFGLMGGSNPLQVLSQLGPSVSVNGAAPVPLQLAALPQAGETDAAKAPTPGSSQGPVPSAPAQADVASLVSACDRLAADADDPVKPADVAGTKGIEEIDHARAIPACEAAHAAAPNEPRITFELGRAYAAAGRDADAARLYREAADAGESVAQYELAMDYYNGRGVSPDPMEAIKLLQASAAQGNGYAAYWLGTEKVNGTNIPADYAGAMELFRKAADFGVPEALTELGKMYYRGQNVPVDYAKALDYFRRAAVKNAASGYFYVGFMEALGLGGAKPNPAVAAADMMKGLLLGDADAQAIIVDGGAKTFDVSVRKAIQTYLHNEGFYSGTADGVLGPGTQQAIAAWRSAKRG
ncbi:peptidoglycan-binding protein [Jiella sp. M17.18]|uniref:peptidoglycan-binding protein n=1 Tax=Jiella sp. M17.18 TaxID=3234247 RepID=UPI0034DFCE73